MGDFTRLRTIKQIAQQNSAFSEPSLRWLVFQSRVNGFALCVVKVQGRVFIDIDQFDKWLDSHRSSGTTG